METQNQEGSTHREPLDFRELIGYAVGDKVGRKVGVLDAVLLNQEGHPAFFGIRAGIFGLSRMHCLPAPLVDVDEAHTLVRLPFEAKVLADSPAFDDDFEFTGEAENRVNEYYRSKGFTVETLVPGQA